MNANSTQPTPVYTGSAVSQIDAFAIQQCGTDAFKLMCEAGQKAFDFIERQFGERPLIVLCGTGNNGGDGYVVAKLALEKGWPVTAASIAPPKTESAKQALKEYLEAGGEQSPLPKGLCPSESLIVDALLGTGISDAPRDLFAQWIEWANTQACARVAIDVPSGINSDTGSAYSPAFSADATVTFIGHKLGLLTGPAANCVGDLLVAPLAIPQKAFSSVSAVAQTLIKPSLPSRRPDTHKGSYGHALVVGSSEGMLGAGILSSTAALRSGCGKVHLASNNPNIELASIYRPEIMTAKLNALPQLVESASAIAIGPGLGLDDSALDALLGVLQLVLESSKSLVIDADALTLISKNDITLPKNTILTPHPGEAARLLNTSTQSIQNDRLLAASTIAEQFNCVCVLKGHGTLIYANDHSPEVCTLGNPGMATAGSGDVLTGILVSLLAQGATPFKAASNGVWLHARAADIASHRSSMQSLIASDITDCLGAAIAETSTHLNYIKK